MENHEENFRRCVEMGWEKIYHRVNTWDVLLAACEDALIVIMDIPEDRPVRVPGIARKLRGAISDAKKEKP